MKVFLSHSAKDAAFVTNLAAALEANGFTPWLCDVAIDKAENFVARINDGLAQSDIALLVWSPDSTTIGFFSGGRLRTISVQGSDLRNLTSVSAPQGGTWNGGVKDGVIVFVSDGRLQSFDLGKRESRTLPVQYPTGAAPAFRHRAWIRS